MSAEWLIPDASIPVRQGDLLICRDPHKRTIDEICLVITADCDISKGKFGRQLACLRIVPFPDYLRTIWAARKLRRTVDTATEKVRAQIVKWHTKLLGAESTLTAEATAQWVRRADPFTICTELCVPTPDVAKLTATLTAYRNALSVLETEPPLDPFARLVAFRSANDGKDPETCRTETIKQAQGEPLPEDVFLLPSLPQVDIGSAVVLLREIVGVNHDSVCYRTVDAATSEMFLRVGRLQPTVKYAISQAFGFLFSRIGLPDDFERRCKEAVDRIPEFDWR